MSGAHGMYVKDKNYIQDLMTNLMVRDHFEHTGTARKTISQ